MLGRVKTLLRRLRGTVVSDQPPEAVASPVVPRWSDEELVQRKQTLENIPSQDWTAQNHYDSLEYVIQRYHPRDVPLFQKDWDRQMARMRSQVDANIRAAADGLQAPSDYQEVNRLIETRRELLTSSYDMPLHDFTRVVMTALQSYPFAEGLELSDEQTRTLWLASTSLGTHSTHEERYEASDARDALVGLVSPAVMDAAASLRRTYEILRRASNAGCETVCLIAPAKCGCLRDLLDGREVSVSHLLGTFESGKPSIPPARTPCTVGQSPQICPVEVFPIEMPLDRPGADPDFDVWLRETLGNSRPPLDADWESKLLARVHGQEPHN